jgi:hypothetical protein
MAGQRKEDIERHPVYVIRASLVEWSIFAVFVYMLVTIVAMRDQIESDMATQRRLFEESNKAYMEAQRNTMYDILASKLKELRLSFDESNKIAEAMCKP